MTFLVLALIVLAAARLTRFVVIDEVGAPVRNAARRLGSAVRGDVGYEWVDRLVGCPWCCGFWLSLASTPFAAAVVSMHWVGWLAWPWAVSWVVGHLNAKIQFWAET